MNKSRRICHVELLNINYPDMKKSNYCLISTYKKIKNKILTEKKIKLYKRRWKIETLFQNLKFNYSENP